jgi:hypothetical protein
MNLLPPSEKKVVRERYRRRLLVVALVFFTILISIILISISISYMASAYEIMVVSREVELISKTNDTKGVAANISTIKDTNGKLDILTKNSTKSLGYDLSTVFSSIIDSAKVKLTSFAYDQIETKKDQTKETGHRIIVGGIAKDRETLRDFVKILQSDKRFKSVDLPVSNLIESKDIKFFITIMIAKK